MSQKPKYLIGIDGGTQSTKVFVFDLEGNVVTQAHTPLQALYQPQPGVAEHPDDDLWSTLASTCRQVIDQLKGKPYEIIAIGLCSIRCCRAELSKHGELISPLLNWKDLRLASAYQPSSSGAHYVTTASGYLTYKLTGQTRDTAANYEGVWPIDKSTWQWSNDAELFQACGTPRKMLFELCSPGTTLGRITSDAAKQTGLPVNAPVVATANDKAVEALGAGLSANPANRNTALISLGTYIGAMIEGDINQPNSSHHFTNMSAVPDHYLFESAGVRNGMGIISWFRDLIGLELQQTAAKQACRPEAILDQEAAALSPGSDGLICLPNWLASTDKPYQRGALIGLHDGHTRAHLHRALLEAIALTMNNNLNAMLQHLNRDTHQIIVSGGGANSDVFTQIFADVTGKAIHRSMVHDAAALGSAICAAVAVGAYDSFTSASAKMVKMRDTTEPNLENSLIYQQLNDQVYKELNTHTDKVLTKLYPIFNLTDDHT